VPEAAKSTWQEEIARMSGCPDEYTAFAHRLADLAGEILRDAMHREVRVALRPDGTPVTEADRMVESALRRAIETTFPHHGIIGEEFPATSADAEWVWIIDRLDGTKEFIQGLPLFGTLIALAHRGQLLLELAEQPLRRDRWIGVSGHGTRFIGLLVMVRSCARLEDAVVSVMGYDSFCAAHHERLSRIRDTAASVVIADSFYVFGLLANGRVDLIVSNGFALHDFAALDVIVREAGGVVTDWNGEPLTLASGPSIIAAGDPALAWKILPQLRGLPD
jgi:histidinol-phosphatase